MAHNINLKYRCKGGELVTVINSTFEKVYFYVQKGENVTRKSCEIEYWMTALGVGSLIPIQ